jgi:hypothetical protein
METKKMSLICACFLLYAGSASAQQVNVASINAVAWPCDEVAPNVGDNAIDGDVNTYWESLADNFKKDIEIELDKVYEIHKVVIKWHAGFVAAPWDVVFDTDGTYGFMATPNTSSNSNCIYSINHTDYASFSDSENVVDASYPPSGSPYNTKINFPYQASFVKLFFRGRNGNTHYEVSEIELWGTEIGSSNLKKLNVTNFKTYPNPVTDVLNIQTESLIESVSILNLNGNLLEKHPVGAKNYTLSTSDWAKGIYLVKVVTENGVQTQRIIK